MQAAVQGVLDTVLRARRGPRLHPESSPTRSTDTAQPGARPARGAQLQGARAQGQQPSLGVLSSAQGVPQKCPGSGQTPGDWAGRPPRGENQNHWGDFFLDFQTCIALLPGNGVCWAHSVLGAPTLKCRGRRGACPHTSPAPPATASARVPGHMHLLLPCPALHFRHPLFPFFETWPHSQLPQGPAWSLFLVGSRRAQRLLSSAGRLISEGS